MADVVESEIVHNHGIPLSRLQGGGHVASYIIVYFCKVLFVYIQLWHIYRAGQVEFFSGRDSLAKAAEDGNMGKEVLTDTKKLLVPS